MAGVKLDNNTENTKHSERWRKLRSALWLEWNSTTTQDTRNKANGEFNDVNTCKNVKLWLEWNSTTTQETRNKANGELNDVKTYEFSEITKTKALWGDEGVLQRQQRSERRNEKTSIPSNFRKQSRKWGVSRYHCGWSCASTTTQEYETGEKPSWNVCSNGHDTVVMNWQYAGLRVRSKSSGLPIVGVSKYCTRQ